VAVSLSLANHTASLPVAYRLYLPQEWADDPARRQTAGVPEEITFQTKPEIALDQIRVAAEAGLPRGVILMDAGYGSDTQLRTSLTTLEFRYIARHPVKHLRLGAGDRTAAAQAVVGAGTAAQADAPGWRAPADLGQGAGAGS
jgi:SRSO17 transposase